MKLIKGHNKDLNKWINMQWLWVGRFNVIKILSFSKLISKYNVLPTKIPTGFFMFRNFYQMILELLWKNKFETNQDS